MIWIETISDKESQVRRGSKWGQVDPGGPRVGPGSTRGFQVEKRNLKGLLKGLDWGNAARGTKMDEK